MGEVDDMGGFSDSEGNDSTTGDVTTHTSLAQGIPLRFTVKRSTVFSYLGAKVLKKHRNLEWCEGKKLNLEKR